jgi:O-antigen/teichoic acid export membrane protein
MMKLKGKATQSVFWSATERFSVQGVQFVLTLIIARILSPEDYGLIAMLGIFIALSGVLVDSGFAHALIQKKERSEQDYNTAFHFNAVGSVVLYAIIYACAPLIARFFAEPLLTDITRVFALNLIINSLGIVQQARLTVLLDFRRQAIAAFIAVLLSGSVGLWMAYSGYGVWTLVWQTLLNNFFRVGLLWVFASWLPRMTFSMRSFRQLFSFGSKLMLSTLLHTFYTNCYSLFIGKFFPASDLGFFNRAQTIAQFPSINFTSIVVRAVYPIQCRYQDDMPRLQSTFLTYMRMSCYLIFPIMTMVIVLSPALISVLLTDKWLPAAPMLQVLCFAYMWDPVMKINHTMLNVKGRTDYFLYAEILKKIVAFTILFITLHYDVMVMCWGLALYSFADMGIIICYSRRLTHIGFRKQIGALLPILLLNAAAGVSAYGVSLLFVSPLMQLLVGTAAGISVYWLGSYLFRLSELNLLKGLFLQKNHP